MAEIPVIKGIMARAGADELGIDPVGLNETDMLMSLAPKSEWPNADKQWFLAELRRVLDSIPGIAYAFTQPIDMRVQEMIIGARGDVVVKVLGDDIVRSTGSRATLRASFSRYRARWTCSRFATRA